MVDNIQIESIQQSIKDIGEEHQLIRKHINILQTRIKWIVKINKKKGEQ